MDTPIKDCTVEELEERAMLGEAQAAAELARRYRTGTGGVAGTVRRPLCGRDARSSWTPALPEEPDEGQEPGARAGGTCGPGRLYL